MFELIDRPPAVDVQESEYKRLLGYPADHVLSGRPRELADRSREWYALNGHPWIYARLADQLDLTHERLQVNRAVLASKRLHHQLDTARAHAAVLVAVSAGPECEERARQLWREEKPDEYFFMEMYGSAVVEYLITVAGGRICDWAEQNGMAALPHYSPGYSGWDVSDQINLWRLIRPPDVREFPGDIEVLETGMLRPKKSLLALFGLTRHTDAVRSLRGMVPCENCFLPACPYRRAPYRDALPQIEDVRRLQPKDSGHSAARFVNAAPGPDAKYSVGLRALEKWSTERLQLETLPDGSVTAWFRYEGTTCSNLGRPLEFHYHLRLAPAAQQFRVLDARCLPAPDDIGHQSMCEYLNDAESLMARIAGEAPLLGRPLHDVFAWKRQFSPSGCYCDAASRAHKWGLVLEVIHYALARQPDPLNHHDGRPSPARNASEISHDKTM